MHWDLKLFSLFVLMNNYFASKDDVVKVAVVDLKVPNDTYFGRWVSFQVTRFNFLQFNEFVTTRSHVNHSINTMCWYIYRQIKNYSRNECGNLYKRQQNSMKMYSQQKQF